LAQISKLFLLKALFKHVVITPGVKREVVDEGVQYGYDDALIVKQAIDEGWILTKKYTRTPSTVKKLAEGERISKSDAETLLLAKENKVDLVLIDEKVLSDLAKMYGFEVWNIWIILLEALRKGLIELSDIKSAINELSGQRHRLNSRQATEILEAAKFITSARNDREKT